MITLIKGEVVMITLIKGEVVLADFWHDFGKQFPDHPVVADLANGTTSAAHLLPVNIHGDGGRTYRKSELLVVQFQSCLGRGTNLSGQVGKKRKLDGDIPAAEINLKGHSLSNRFLISVMAKKYLDEKKLQGRSPLLELLGYISDWFGELYRDGFQHAGKTWKLLPIGLKGDLVFQAKAASLQRTFSRVRKFAPGRTTKKLQGICCWCMAGSEKVGFENFGRDPDWLATMGPNNPAPWESSPSVLRSIPVQPDEPSFLKPDLFHVVNIGVQKDMCGSSLVLILAEFPGSSHDERMANMNISLKAFLKKEHLYLHCHRLTMDLIGAGNNKSYASGGWNKGQDSVVLAKFIPWAVREVLPVNASERPWKYIVQGCEALGEFMRTLYAQAVFMEKSAANHAATLGFQFLLCYSKLVEWAMGEGRLLYNLTPKLHYYHHVVMELLTMSENPGMQRVFNPLCNSTAQCEDFIGHISRLSRRVSAKQPHTRLLRRYQAALANRLGLLG